MKVIFWGRFKNIFSKIRDSLLKERILKQVEKIKVNPEVGKPMRNIRKGTGELYIKPFRLPYIYFVDKSLVCLLDLYHKKKQ